MFSRFVFVLASSLPALAAASGRTPFRDLFFEPNRGQAPAHARYIARTPGAVMLFDNEGVEVRLNAAPARPVRLRLDGVSRDARFEALEANNETTSYFLGADRAKWVRGVPHHRKLAWRGLYPGVDVLFYGTDARLEYDFVLAPGADPSRLRMKIDGATRVESNADGGIVMHASTERFEMRAPKVYQGAESVEARYRLHGSTVTFEVGDYDRSRTLVVDPVVYTTYGGEKDDSVVGVTSNGDVVGVTSSASYTGTFEKRGKDIFALIPQTGKATQLLILSGSDDDVATSADAYGTRYLMIGGWTRSADLVAKATAQGVDGFVLSIDRTILDVRLMRIGGSGDDRVWSVSGLSFAGETSSPDLTATYYSGQAQTQFPATGSLNGNTDGFYCTASQFGSNVTLSYWGGSGDDAIYSISTGFQNLLLGGRTTSNDLPVVNAVQPQLAGGADGFFALIPLGYAGASTPIVTYIGGSGDDEVRAVQRGNTDRMHLVAGITRSTDLPVVKAAQSSYGGGESDGFLGVIDAGQPAYRFLTYIGGSGRDEVAALTVPLSGYPEPVVVGTITSADLPVKGAVQEGLRGPSDGFVGQYSLDGEMLMQTWLGGSGRERLNAAFLSSSYMLTVGGETDSNDLGPGAPLQAGLDGFTASLPLARFVMQPQAVADGSEFWTAKDLTTRATITLANAASGASMLTLTSADPSKILVSFNSYLPPASSVSAPASLLVSGGVPTVSVYLTGVADSGETTVSVALDGVGTLQLPVKLGPLGIRLYGASNTFYTPGSSISVTASACVRTRNSCYYGDLAYGAEPIHVALALSDPSLAKVQLEHPSTITSESSFVATLIPQKPGQLSVSLTADRGVLQEPSTLDVTIRYPQYRLPDFAAAKGLITEGTMYLDGVLSDGQVTITSSDPARLCLWVSDACRESTVVGASSYVPFRVKALADSGTVELHYSSDQLGEATQPATLVRADAVLSGPAGDLAPGASTNYTLSFRYGSSQFSLFASDAAAIRVTSSDPKVLRIDRVSGQTISATALTPGQATLTATIPGFTDPAPLTVTVAPLSLATQPPTSLILGKDMTVAFSAPAGASVKVKAVSADPSMLLVSASSTAVGTDTASVVSGGQRAVFWAQALAASGSTTITLSADGYPDAVIPVRFTPSGFAWQVPQSTTGIGTVTYYAQPYSLDPDTLAPVLVQSLRAGRTAQPSVTSSNPAVGTYSGSTFKALAAGVTMLSIAQPEGFSAPSVRRDLPVTVALQALSLSRMPSVVGKDMVSCTNQWSSVKMTVRSDDPSRLLVSDGDSVAGQPQVETQSTICFHGLASDGVVQVRVSATGMLESVFPVMLVRSGVRFSAQSVPLAIKTLATTAGVNVGMFAPSPIGSSNGRLRPGADPIVVGISSSNPSVVAPLSDTVTLAPGARDTATVSLRPGDPGTAVLRLAPPAAFHTSAQDEELAVKVTRPSFSAQPISAVRGLLLSVRFTLNSSDLNLPATIVTTITSNDPSRLLVAGSSGDTAQASVSIPYNTLSGGSATFVVQGVTSGTARLTVSAPGFDPATFDVTVQDAVISISAEQGAVVGTPANVSVVVNGTVPSPGLTLRLNNSDPSVLTVPETATIPAGSERTLVAVKPIAAGQATVTVDPPDGYTISPDHASARVTVKLPDLPLQNAGDSVVVGYNLQQERAVHQYSVDSLVLTVVSSDPSKVLLSLDRKQAGLAAVTLTLGRSQPQTLYVQALAASGTATLTWSAPGYVSATSQVTLSPSGFGFDQASFTAQVGRPATLRVVPTMTGNYVGQQAVRGGLGAVTMGVSLSTPSVGTLTPSTLTFTGGDLVREVTFTPLAAGSATLAVGQPAGHTAPRSALIGVVVQ